MLKRFFKPELNRLNAFEKKNARDALMLYTKSRKSILKKFHGAEPIYGYSTGAFLRNFHFKKRWLWKTIFKSS